MCQLFDLNGKTHTMKASCHSKLVKRNSIYLEPLISLMLPKAKKMSLTSENGHYKYEEKG